MMHRINSTVFCDGLPFPFIPLAVWWWWWLGEAGRFNPDIMTSDEMPTGQLFYRPKFLLGEIFASGMLLDEIPV